MSVKKTEVVSENFQSALQKLGRKKKKEEGKILIYAKFFSE